MKVVIAGGSGWIGSHLETFFKQLGYEIILLSRNPSSHHKHFWDPETQQVDLSIFEGSDVVINLCGENIFGRWNQKKMEKIRSSRVQTSQFLCDTLLRLNILPKLYIGASAIGYYGDRKGEILVESSPPGDDFLSQVCQEWESIPQRLLSDRMRVVLSRFGIVLGKDGGALKQIEKAFKMGMGGILGSGKQMMSWIAIDDLCGALQQVIEKTELTGPINFVAPQAVSNSEFTETLGKILHHPPAVTVPKFALTLIFGEAADMFLASQHVLPKRLLESGYHFQYPDLEQALRKCLN